MPDKNEKNSLYTIYRHKSLKIIQNRLKKTKLLLKNPNQEEE